tara:strand:+ start:330 stop:602 length:273 start_codon:yes stop_codon:yes gene_type:complete
MKVMAEDDGFAFPTTMTNMTGSSILDATNFRRLPELDDDETDEVPMDLYNTLLRGHENDWEEVFHYLREPRETKYVSVLLRIGCFWALLV